MDPDKAGRWHAPQRLPSALGEAPYGLNCNALTLVCPDRQHAGIRAGHQGRSSSLRCGRSTLHLDPGPRPHRPKPGRRRGPTTEKTTDSQPLRGSPTQIRGLLWQKIGKGPGVLVLPLPRVPGTCTGKATARSVVTRWSGRSRTVGRAASLATCRTVCAAPTHDERCGGETTAGHADVSQRQRTRSC